MLPIMSLTPYRLSTGGARRDVAPPADAGAERDVARGPRAARKGTSRNLPSRASLLRRLPAETLRRARTHQYASQTKHNRCTQVLGNIVSRPSEPKVRSLKKSNEKFQRALWSVAGGADLLKHLGFADLGETVTLPQAAEVAPLRLVRRGGEGRG